MWKHQDKNYKIFSYFLILFMLLLSWALVYLTGGTKYGYLHIIYVPIVFAGFMFGPKGGVVVAFMAGFLIGPIMPLDVSNEISQSLVSSLYRTFFLVLIGSLIGLLSNWLRIYLDKVQEAFDEMSLVYGNTLRNCANLVSLRDEQTAFHCERVAYNACMIGKSIKLNKIEMETLYWTGLLHDVGKIGVKEEILLKPGKLSAEEFEEIKLHTTIGYDLINSLSPKLKNISEGVRSHHEKWNGNGYPRGLKGEEIPLFGRILAVVDVFEALTSERPYKSAWDPKEAIQYIIKYKGVDFDPKIVDCLEDLFINGKLWVNDNQTNINEGINPTMFRKDIFELVK